MAILPLCNPARPAAHHGGDADPGYGDGGFEFEKGWLKRPEKPGLGIIVDEEKVRKAAEEGHDWKNAVWHLQDGTPIDW